jgi:hypothetical protein
MFMANCPEGLKKITKNMRQDRSFWAEISSQDVSNIRQEY